MVIPKKIRVLVVDDSLLFREVISNGISNDLAIEVVGTAGDAFEARDKIIDLEPDVLTLDVEMPKMNGIEFLKKLMPQYPLPVVVVSAVKDNVFEALNAGAVDFVTKVNSVTGGNLDSFINELVIKIKIASMAKVGHYKKITNNQHNEEKVSSSVKNTIIAIGASTGGTEAIFEIVKHFPIDMPGVVIAQHMPPGFTKMYAERLNNSCNVEVKEAENGDVIKQGRVLIAPGDKHMVVSRSGNEFFVRCQNSEKVNGHRPSVDVLFNSVAEKARANAIGIILTGMGYDGAKGLLKMKQNGAYTIGQDEQSSVVYGMPMVAYNLGAVKKQVSLLNIPGVLFSLLRGRN